MGVTGAGAGWSDLTLTNTRTLGHGTAGLMAGLMMNDEIFPY